MPNRAGRAKELTRLHRLMSVVVRSGEGYRYELRRHSQSQPIELGPTCLSEDEAREAGSRALLKRREGAH